MRQWDSVRHARQAGVVEGLGSPELTKLPEGMPRERDRHGPNEPNGGEEGA
jgi:hypothetical protein